MPPSKKKKKLKNRLPESKDDILNVLFCSNKVYSEICCRKAENPVIREAETRECLESFFVLKKNIFLPGGKKKKPKQAKKPTYREEGSG